MIKKDKHAEKELLNGKKKTASPIISLSVVEPEKFKNIPITANGILTIKKIGDSIIYLKFSGNLADSRMEQAGNWCEKFIREAHVTASVVEILDMSELTDILPEHLNKYLKKYISNRSKNPAGLVLSGVLAGIKDFTVRNLKSSSNIITLKVAKNYKAAVSAALKILKSMNAVSQNKHVAFSQQNIDEIADLCKNLLPDKQKNTDHIVSPDNPLNQLKETLDVLKKDIRVLRKHDNRRIQNLEAVLEAIQTGLLILDRETHNIIFANTAAAALANTTLQKIMGKPCYDFLCPSSDEAYIADDLKLPENNMESVLIRPDGSRCPVIKSIQNFEFNETPCLLATFIDITEIKKAQADQEDQLADLEQGKIMLLRMMEDAEAARAETAETNQYLRQIQMAIDASSNGISISTPDGKNFYQNKTFTHMFGYNLEEYNNQPAGRLFRDKKNVEDMLSKVMERGSYNSELIMISRTGRRFPVHLRANAVKNEQDETIALIGVYTDISKRRQAEKRLHENKERLDLALSVLNDGIWDWHLDSNTTHFDSRLYTMAGYEPNEFPGLFEELEKRIHLEDLNQFRQDLEQFIAGKTKTYLSEFRFLRKSGDYMWIQARGKIVSRDETGNPVRYVGIHSDINKHILREKRIDKLNKLQAQLLKPEVLEVKLKRITETLASTSEIDFSRIWLLRPKDRCKKGCIYPQHCKKNNACLHLIASAGQDTQIAGDQTRIPLYASNISRIWEGQDSLSEIDNINRDINIDDYQWAEELGLISVDGFQLTDSEGQSIGVIAAFSKDPISSEIRTYMESLAILTSQVILNYQANSALEKALKVTERANTLMEGREIRIRKLKAEINALAKQLGKNEIYKIEHEEEEDSFLAGETVKEDHAPINLQESRMNALSLAEDAEVARREAVEVNEQLSIIKQAVNSSSDGVLMSTFNGDFFYLNATFTKMFNYKLKELATMPVKSLFKDKDYIDKVLVTVQSGKSWNDHVDIISREEKSLPVYLRIAPFRDDNNRILGLVWLFTDISEQKKAEEKIYRYTKKIEEDLAEKEAILLKARLLQTTFIQSSVPLLKEFNIHALFMPCEKLGGDFFRVLKGEYENKLIIIIGDCTDHGIKASMDASVLSSIVNQHISMLYRDNRTDLLLTKVSQDFMEVADEDQFPTMFAAVIDLETNEMFYSNANSERPCLIRNKEVIKLDNASGLHLGYFDDPVYERKSFQFHPGDRLLFYSDAIIEIEKEDHSRAGYSGVKSILSQFDSNAENDFNFLIDQIKKENNGFPLSDDTTLILIELGNTGKWHYRHHNTDECERCYEKIKTKLFELDYSSNEIAQIIIALNEMCINAFCHGNKKDENKSITVTAKIDCKQADFSIEDEGEGFNLSEVPDPSKNLEQIYDEGIEEKYTHGRGIWLVNSYMDSVKYNEKGNRVTLIKYKNPKPLRYS